MSPVLMLDTYKAHTIRITMALAYFVHGDPATKALPIWTVAIDDELLSARKWDAAGLLLGVETDQEYQAVPFHLDHGDTLLMTTDGITEARRGKEFLGVDGLTRLVQEAQPLGTLDQKAQSILAGARGFGGGSFRDDVCLVLARKQ